MLAAATTIYLFKPAIEVQTSVGWLCQLLFAPCEKQRRTASSQRRIKISDRKFQECFKLSKMQTKSKGKTLTLHSRAAPHQYTNTLETIATLIHCIIMHRREFLQIMLIIVFISYFEYDASFIKKKSL